MPEQRICRDVIAGAGATVLIIGMTGAASASADDVVKGVRITSLTVDRPAVAPSGLQSQRVTVSVGLSADAPLSYDCPWGYGSSIKPTLSVQRVTPADPRIGTEAPSSHTAYLRLSSGTLKNGVWKASIPVPSTWAGTWQVSNVSACAGGGAYCCVPEDPWPEILADLALSAGSSPSPSSAPTCHACRSAGAWTRCRGTRPATSRRDGWSTPPPVPEWAASG